MTIDDYEKLPDAMARNHELVSGDLVEEPGNTPRHHWLRSQLAGLLRSSCPGVVFCGQAYDFGGNAHGPDVSFLAEPLRRQIDWDKRVQRFVPDFAVEIVLPDEAYESLMKKARRYRESGTNEVWILSIALRHAICFNAWGEVLLGEGDVFAPGPVPGFSIRIGELLDQIPG